jgi:nucleoid-associated protein YgaU
LGWILPLLVLAGLIGLIWHWSAGRSARAGGGETRVTEQAGRPSEEARTKQMLSLEALKVKYDTAIQEARDKGVQISGMTAQEGKLVIHGTAPSTEAAESFRAQIMRINPKMDDVAVDISVDSSLAPSTPSTKSAANGIKQEESTGVTPKAAEGTISRAKPTAPSESSPESGTQMYTVERGDTLSGLSKQFYGNSNHYMRIFNQNKSELKDKNTLTVGQKLEIPMK